jgi:hypothetical protein
MALTEYEGHRLLDIRKYFVEKGTKSLKPTRKGVSLNAGVARQVLAAMHDNAEAILAWLEREDDSALTEVERAMQARTRAVEEEAIRPRPFQIKQADWKGAEFFACDSYGAEDHVAFNAKHPFFRYLQNGQSHAAAGHLPIALLLASYYRAKLRFSGDIEGDADQFFQLLEHEWGMILMNYCHSQGSLGDG